MRVGQKSVVVFVSRLLGSVLGFFATIYFARVLGAEVLGLYALVIAIVAWLRLGGKMGVGSALTKRISEGEEQGQFYAAGILSIAVIGTVLSIGVIALQNPLEAYVGDFDQYVAISVVWFVVLLLYAKLVFALVKMALKGERLVHIAGLLSPVNIGSRSLIQIGLVIAGFNLAGMLIGYAAGAVLAGLVGLYYITVPVKRPRKRHFASLYEYAKYSWFGSVRSRSFNDVDILVLGLFVPSALVGVYSVAWTIAKFLKLFGGAISTTLFPEISHQDAQGKREAVEELIEDGLAYSGLVAIPGLVGGVLIDDRLLRIYGEEFVQGTGVLGLLIFATLVYSYQQQLLNAMNAVDRPDLAFRVNVVFTGLNAILNVVLVVTIGWVGAAIATALSAVIGVAISYGVLARIVTVRIPGQAISRQVVAAVLMGVVVYGVRVGIEGSTVANYNAAFVVGLVGVGAITYFFVLLGISEQFRTTIQRNLPETVQRFVPIRR